MLFGKTYNVSRVPRLVRSLYYLDPIWVFYWNRSGLCQVCKVTSAHFWDITQDNRTVGHHAVQNNQG